MRAQWLNACGVDWCDGVSLALGIELKADVEVQKCLPFQLAGVVAGGGVYPLRDPAAAAVAPLIAEITSN